MKKKQIQRINYFLFFLFYLFLIISCFLNSRYENYNIFRKLFSAPFCELTYWISRIVDIRIAFFFTFAIGIFVLYPIFTSIFSNLKKMVVVWKKILLISKQQVHSEEEQIKKTQEMLEVYEKDGISLFSLVALILCSFLGTYFLKAMFRDIFYSSLFENANWHILWFNLNDRDALFILPITCIILITILPIIKNIIKIKSVKSEYEKTNLIISILITLAGSCLLVYPIFSSSMFSIFIITINLFGILKKSLKKTGVETDEKFFIKN